MGSQVSLFITCDTQSSDLDIFCVCSASHGGEQSPLLREPATTVQHADISVYNDSVTGFINKFIGDPRVNPHKATRACADQLTDVLTDISNTFLSQAMVPLQNMYQRNRSTEDAISLELHCHTWNTASPM